jgi:TrmH family RNA methyltransferase
MVPVITSFANPTIKHVRALHRSRRRRTDRLTLVEGPTTFAQVVAAGVEPETVLVAEDDAETVELCRQHDWKPIVVSRGVLSAASDTVHPQSPVAVIPIPEAGALRDRHTLILVDVSDPGNVGTMIRSAAAFGWDVCISGSTADPWSPKVLRSAAGSHFEVHLSHSSDPVLDGQSFGLDIVATVASDGSRPGHVDRSVGLLIGSEAHGLPDALVERSAVKVTLPMVGDVESLNAGVAASILMYVLTVSTEFPAPQ